MSGSAGGQVCINNLSRRGGADGAFGELIFEVLSRSTSRLLAVFAGAQTSFGRLDVRFQAVDVLLFGVAMEDFEFGRGIVEFAAGFFDGETISLELDLGNVTSGSETIAVAEVFFGPAQVFLSDKLIANEQTFLLTECA